MAVISLGDTLHLREYTVQKPVILANRASGNTYRRQLQVHGNSLLSTVYVKTIDPGASLVVSYTDWVTEEKIDSYTVKTHNTMTIADSHDRVLVTRFHDKLFLDCEVIGGNVEFLVTVGLISDQALDISPTSLEDLYKTAENNKITNVSISSGDINIEQSLSLTNNLKTLIINPRNHLTTFKYSFVSGESGTKYRSMKHGILAIGGLNFTSKTLYYQVDKVGVIEFEEFY